MEDEGSLGDEQWFLSGSHIQGVDLSDDINYVEKESIGINKV